MGAAMSTEGNPITAFNDLGLVYMPSGASEAGESEPDMYPASQWAVTTDPANEVLSGIYIGSMATALNHASLKNKGITHILNMSDYEDCPAAYAPSDFEYLILNVPDQLEIRRYLHGAIHFLREGRRRSGGVLVHCKDPSGVLSISAILGYLIAFEGLELEDAIKLVDRKRHVDLPPDVLQHLHEYEIGLKQVPGNTRQYFSRHPEIKKDKPVEEMKQVDEANIIRHQWSPNSDVLGYSGKDLCRAPNLEAPTTGKAGRVLSETEQIHRRIPDIGFAVYTHMPSITKERERAHTGQDAWQPGMGDSRSVSDVPAASSKEPELHQYLTSLKYWNRQSEAKTFIPLPSEKPSKTDVPRINDIGVPAEPGQLLVEGLAPYRRYAPVHVGDQIWQDRSFWTRPDANSTLHIIA